MKFKAALFYNGFIAYYSIYLIGTNTYKVKLDTYNGDSNPPHLIELYKNGFSWNANCNDPDLIRELSAAIEYKLS